MLAKFIPIILAGQLAAAMGLPTLAIGEVTSAIQDPETNPDVKVVMEGLLNDFMDLAYSKETPYTLGQQILPTGVTIDNVDAGRKSQGTSARIMAVLNKMAEKFRADDYTSETVNQNGSYDPRFKPVLQFIVPDPLH